MATCEFTSQPYDGNSGDSDFEIVCNSDSEAEGNGYKKLSDFRESPDFYAKRFHLNQHSEKLDCSVVQKGKLEKINLSLSQEKNSFSGEGKDKPEEDSVKKLYSGDFIPKFSINSIHSASDNNKESDTKVRSSNLPEIVLTSYEKDNSNQMNNNSPSPASKPSPDLKICRERNSQSPELYLERKLTTSSVQSTNATAIGTAYSAAEPPAPKPMNLVKALPYQMSVDLNHPSATTLISGAGLDHFVLFNAKGGIPDELKCKMCGQLYKDPRTLNCLHSFCFQCLVNENFGKDESIPFWSRPNGTNFEWKGNYNSSTKSSGSGDSDYQGPLRPESRSSISSFKSKKSSDRKSKDKSSTSSPKHSTAGHSTERTRILVCSICQYCTEMPVGGIRQLPQNLILVRKVENLLLKEGNDVISNSWCSLCCMEVPATYHCITCMINLCGFCREAHDRQKTTAGHNVKNILELQRSRSSAKKTFDATRMNMKCALHPGFDLKSFCNTCQQIICSDCAILLHKGHKIDSAHKAFKTYQKILKESSDKSKPLCEYVEHSILKLGGISKKIHQKCDQVQRQVDTYMAAYFEAVEVHRKILIQQISRARETKMQMILEQQLEMERQAKQTKEAVTFAEELFELGNEIEILSFVSILLKRFEYCQKFKPSLDAKVYSSWRSETLKDFFFIFHPSLDEDESSSKISDSLHFLPEVRAPSTKAQNNIPLYGIITMQTVEPQYCTLETEGYTQLRVHKKVELIVLTRDADGAPLCHGGLDVKVQIKYKDSSSKLIEAQVSDRRDGTYAITFSPDFSGTLIMSITIHNRHIKGSPFTLLARTVRPHTGIFHCCSFCSSKGSKTAVCACDGVMPGFKGCGHGHPGHPGRRHWSCCGSILENSECATANIF